MWSRALGGMTGADAWQEDLFLMPEAACVCTGMCHTPTQCKVCTNDGWHSDYSICNSNIPWFFIVILFIIVL